MARDYTSVRIDRATALLLDRVRLRLQGESAEEAPYQRLTDKTLHVSLDETVRFLIRHYEEYRARPRTGRARREAKARSVRQEAATPQTGDGPDEAAAKPLA